MICFYVKSATYNGKAITMPHPLSNALLDVNIGSQTAIAICVYIDSKILFFPVKPILLGSEKRGNVI